MELEVKMVQREAGGGEGPLPSLCYPFHERTPCYQSPAAFAIAKPLEA